MWQSQQPCISDKARHECGLTRRCRGRCAIKPRSAPDLERYAA